MTLPQAHWFQHISTKKYPMESETYVKVRVQQKVYTYTVSQYILEKYMYMLHKGSKGRAYNYLKTNGSRADDE